MMRLTSTLLAGLLLLAAPAHAQECAAPAEVCAAKDAVFAVSSFSPVGSAVRIYEDLLVTNRHVVADETRVEVFTADGAVVIAEVVPTDYPGDLVLLRAPGLPPGPTLTPAEVTQGEVRSIGANVGAGRVGVLAPGAVTALPEPGHPLARVHYSAETKPGNSGGALVDEAGNFVAIIASGGEGRNEAIPATELAKLQAASGPDRLEASQAAGAKVRECYTRVEEHGLRGAPLDDAAAEDLSEVCLATGNRQYYDLAGQILGQGRRADAAVDLFEAALEQDPNSVNSRLSLAITLHLAGRYEEELPHLRWMMERSPEDPQVLRLSVQAGKWGGDPELAESAYRQIAETFPQQAEAARNFLDSDAPPPTR